MVTFDLTNIIYAAEEVVHAAVEAAQESDGGVVGLLGLNIKLFIAQLINFGIVLFILWKWVFKPVTTALRQRTEKIENSLADAKKIEEKMIEMESYQKQQVEKANKDYQKIVVQAENVAKQQKEEILQEAKTRAEKMIRDAEMRMTEEKRQLISEAKQELVDLVVTASERILSEKLDKKKDEKLISEMLKDVKQQ